jgi:microsomal dipeptidase-like Zn-dependent dipeptidase
LRLCVTFAPLRENQINNNMKVKTLLNRRDMLKGEKIDIEGPNHPKRMFDLTEGLIRRKYSHADIEGILGGNFERVLTEIWT